MDNGKFLYKLGIGVLGLTGMLIIYIFYMLLWPYKTIEVTQFDVITPSVKRGECVSIKTNSIKYINKGGTVGFQLYAPDLFAFYYPTSYTNIKRGENPTVFKKQIPDFAPPGKKYRIKMIIAYKVNPLREIIVSTDTNEFEVTNNIEK